MKILILSTSECNGGAAIAAGRLMQALRKAGHNARMLVRDRQTDNPNVVSVNTSRWKREINFLRFVMERGIIFLRNCFSKKNLFAVSLANFGTDISRHPLVREADVLHIHWINQGFLSLKDIAKIARTGKPIVWTMHDMWSFTGVCHYAGDCEKYKTGCENCNLLACSPKSISKKKSKIFKNIQFVGCSHWIADCAKQSAILQNNFITNIPNPINTELFAPTDKIAARKKLNLPTDKKLILFAAAKLSDKRKGAKFFLQACEHLKNEEVEIVFLGGKIDDEIVNKIPLTYHVLGYLNGTEKIVSAYAACDIFVTPSLEDNLPNTIMEAMACGIPCVGFYVGGIPEMIDHKQNGYVAKYKNAEDLAKGIDFCLENSEKLSLAAREKVIRHYSENVVAERYVELYSQKQS